MHGGFDPIQEFGNFGVDPWFLPTFQAPAHYPVDVVGAILLTGQRAPGVTLRKKDRGVQLCESTFGDTPTSYEGMPVSIGVACPGKQ